MSKYTRNKGHNFERYIAKAFRYIFPKARRHLEFQAQEAYGEDLADVGNLAIQCKNFQKYPNPSLIEEIKDTEKLRLLILRANKKKDDLAVIPLYDLMALLSAVLASRPELLTNKAALATERAIFDLYMEKKASELEEEALEAHTETPIVNPDTITAPWEHQIDATVENEDWYN